MTPRLQYPCFLTAFVIFFMLVGCSNNNDSSSSSNGLVSTETVSLGVEEPTVIRKPEQPSLQKILITPENATLHKGQTQQYSAVGLYSDHSLADITKQVEWRSNALPRDILLSNHGQLTVKTQLEAIIEAKDATSGISGSTHLSVNTAILLSISIEPNPIMLHLGDRIKPKIMGYFSDSQQVELTQFSPFRLSTSNFLTQQEDYSLSAKAKGDTSISLTQGGVATSAQVSVSDATINTLTLSPQSASTRLGVNQVFYPIAFYSDGSVNTLNSDLEWSVNKPELANISDNGIVTPLKIGDIHVRVIQKSTGKKAESILSIIPAKLDHLVIYPQNPVITSGLKKQLSVIGVYSDSTQEELTENVSWGIINNTIGDLDPSGLFLAKIAGNSVISAKIDNIKTQTTMTVNEKQVDSIEIATKRKRLPQGVSKQFKAIAAFNDGSVENITKSAQWSSNKPEVATSTTDGKIKGIGIGETEITVSFKDSPPVSQNLIVTNAKLKKIWIESGKEKIQFINGDTKPLYAYGLFSSGDQADITNRVIWVSDNPDVFTVIPSGEKAGLVKAIGLGNASIRIIDKKTQREATAIFNSQEAMLESIHIQTQDLRQLPIGNSAELSAMGTYSNGQKLDITQSVHWQSSDENIAEINNKGMITSKKIGSVSFTASYNNKKASTSLDIVDPKAIDKIIIEPNNAESRPLKAIWFTAKAVFKDGTSLDITKLGYWASDNWNVASIIGLGVSSGRAWTTGRKGTTKITKTYKGQQQTVTLTVK